MKFTYPKTQNILSGYANFCCIPIYIEKHSGATPSITSEQITDDKHKKNPYMLTKVENVAEMSSVAESYRGGGLKPRIFSMWMREFSLNSMWSCRLGRIAPFYA